MRVTVRITVRDTVIVQISVRVSTSVTVKTSMRISVSMIVSVSVGLLVLHLCPPLGCCVVHIQVRHSSGHPSVQLRHCRRQTLRNFVTQPVSLT